MPVTGNMNLIVPIEGGRYDVNMSERKRYAVYWEEEPKMVRRCSWFYKREGDSRYVPYEETFAIKLEVNGGIFFCPFSVQRSLLELINLFLSGFK